MKIALIEGIHLAIPNRTGDPAPVQWPTVEMLLIRVETDAGIVGWGEAFGHAACTASKAALDTLVAPLCIGAAAGDIEGLNERVRRILYAYGPGGPILFALSGVDIALWDIRGQREGKPVHRLLGNQAAVGDVPAYASLPRYGNADHVETAVGNAVARGFSSVKLHESKEDTVVAARAAAGPDIGLMLDVNCRWSYAEALAIAHRIKRLALDWIEEPVWPPHSPPARITEETGIPVAAGENASSLGELARLAESGVAIIQPSAAKLGGLTALVSAARRAREQRARLAPHCAVYGPALAATIHFCAAAKLSCEWYDCSLEASPCAIAPLEGGLPIPQGPGLGITVDSAIVAQYRRR